MPHHTINKEKDKGDKIVINRYERTNSGSVDKQKMKEIVGMLANRKQAARKCTTMGKETENNRTTSYGFRTKGSIDQPLTISGLTNLAIL